MTMRCMMALGMALLAASAAAQDAPAVKRPKNPTAPKKQVTPNLNDQKSRRNYALGVNLGESLKKQHLIELDLNLLVRGLKDAVSGGKTLLTQEEVQTILAEMQNDRGAARLGGALPFVSGSALQLMVPNPR